VIFPVKMVCIGFLIGLTACLTGLTARSSDDAERLLPRGFVRGVIVIMLTSVILSFAA
jgi:phospholipid/cholesterol/gamma-HCH transport system permease protein